MVLPVYTCSQMGIIKTADATFERNSAIYEVVAILIEFHYNVGIGGSYDEDE